MRLGERDRVLMRKIYPDQIALVEEDALAALHCEAVLAHVGDAEGVLPDQAEQVLVAGRACRPPDLEGDVHRAVGEDMPAVDVTTVDEGLVRVEDVDGVIPVIEVLPGNGFITETIGV